MTYTIIGRSGDGNEIGLAVQSKFPGVASNSIAGKANVGVIATQAFSNPLHLERGIPLLELGLSPELVISALIEGDPSAHQRQIAVMTADGTSATYTGEDIIANWKGEAGRSEGQNCLAFGNSLSNDAVLGQMTSVFQENARSGCLATSLIRALQAGESAGGEFRGVQAAGVLVYKRDGGFQGHGGKHVDISVYDHSDPIGELARCFELHKLSYFPSDPSNLEPIEPDYVDELVEILRAEGYLSEGGVRAWGDTEIAAMAMFMGVENYDGRIRDDALIDIEVLQNIRSRRRVSD